MGNQAATRAERQERNAPIAIVLRTPWAGASELVSQWCGAAYDSTILDAFMYAADHHIDVVSISFGGYLDLRDPDKAIIWGEYIRIVQRAAQPKEVPTPAMEG